MIIRSLFLTTTLITTTPCYSFPELPAPDTENLEKDPLYDTKNFVNKPGIQKHLSDHYGAQSVTFNTEDGFALDGTFIRRANATHTTIVPGGFYPGNKESMASWVKALPTDGNIIFFDARYGWRNNSTLTTTIGNLPQYGVHEYKDVLAVMKFAKQENKPIIMSPLCSGAMHTVHALLRLQQQNKLTDYDVRGMIIDSGYVSGMHVLPAGEYHFREKVIPQLLREKIYTNDKSSKEVKERFLYKFIWTFFGHPFVTLLRWFVQSGVEKHDPATRIDDKIDQLNHIPMAFLHAKDDKYAPKEHIEALHKKHNNSRDEIVIFEDADHANIILKKKREYKDQVTRFIAKVMALDPARSSE